MSFYDNQPLTANSVLNELTSIPQELFQEDSGLSSFVLGSSNSKGNIIPGMTIFNNTNPGTIAYAATPPSGMVNGVPAQRLLCSMTSNHKRPVSGIIDFTSKPKELGADRENHLFMHVYPYQHEALTNGERGLIAKDAGGFLNLIPLLVSAGSVSLAPPLTPAELNKLGYQEDISLGLDFGGILGGVVKSIPIIADAGLKIFQELNGGNAVDDAENPEEFALLGLIGSIASIAVPLVGNIIKKAIS